MRHPEASPQNNEVLLRFANGSKFALKEKFVQVYELFFKGNDPSANKPNFWSELFLLKVNHDFLANQIGSLTEEQLLTLRPTVNHIVMNCFLALQDENSIRVGHALETLCAIFSAVFKKKFQNFGIDVVNLLTGMEKAGVLFKSFIENLDLLLKSPAVPSQNKGSVLQLILVIQTATDNINSNTLLEYFMINNIFESLIKVVTDQDSQHLAPEALTALVIFANYAKYEKQNPYLMQLSILAERPVIYAFGAIISNIIRQNLKIIREEIAEENAGMFSQLYSWWYSTPPLEATMDFSFKHRLSLGLFAFYELVYSNQDFANMLMVTITNPEDLKAKSPVPKSASSVSLGSHEGLGQDGGAGLASLTFSRFLTLASHFLDDVKDARLSSLSKIIFLSLGCLLDNKETAYYIYDHEHVTAVVEIHQSKNMRLQLDDKPRGLIEIIFDILSLFVMHNLRKNFQFDLYNLCLDLVQKSLSYQRVHKSKSRINFGHLWKGLIALMSFLVQNGPTFPKSDIFALSEKIVNIFNIAILHGEDIFVDGPTLYNVYYEILRNHELFRNLNHAAVANATGGGTSSSVVSLNLTNILQVYSHFQMKIESWQLLSGSLSLSPEQVVTLIHQNLDTLELKKLEKLEHFERYCEHPQQVTFFRTYLRGLILDCRHLTEESHTRHQKQ